MKKGITGLCVPLVLLACAASAQQSDKSVFGFDLGKKVDLPECSYKPIEDVTCAKDAHTLIGYGQPVREILFSPKECPVIVKNCLAIPLESGEKLIGFHFYTAGIKSQELVFAQLSAKYGKPSIIDKSPVQNLSGATFDSIHAEWQVGDLHVSFSATSRNLESGDVYIDLPEASALRKSWDNADNAERRKL